MVIAITAILGLFAYSRVRIINARTKDLAENAAPSLAANLQMMSNVQKQYGLLLRAAVGNDPQVREGAAEEIAETRAKNHALFDHYEKDLIYNDQEKAIFKDIEEKRSAVNSGMDEILRLSKTGTPKLLKRAAQLAIHLEASERRVC